MDTLKELIGFMKPEQRLDLKVVALTHVLGLTGTMEGKKSLLNDEEALAAIFSLTRDSVATVAKDAVLTLINLTAEADGAKKVYDTANNVHPKFEIIQEIAKHIIDENSELADPWSMVLSNMTRVERLVGDILDQLEQMDDMLLKLVNAFMKPNYNKKGAKLRYLAPIFCNFTQIPHGRKVFCDPKHSLLDRIFPFKSDEHILIRGGSTGILKNICSDPDYHHKIMNEIPDEGVLYALLFPLMGSEEYSEEENDKFPIELQYMTGEKTREEDPDLRKMLLESLLQLCATKKYRELMRAKGVYEILREYHKWETNVGQSKEALMACENVIDILIRTEDEIGVDNLKELDVPDNMSKKFIEDDAAYLKGLEQWAKGAAK